MYFTLMSVYDVSDISDKDGTVKVDFSVRLRWNDPALIRSPDNDYAFGRTGEEYEKLWNPGIEVGRAE